MSTDIPPSLNKFKGELERAIKARLERPPSHKRPRLLAGTTLGAAAGATALTLALTAASSPAAFAVTRNHDGTVSVRIMRLEGLRGANRRLAEMKLHVRLAGVPVPAGCPTAAAVPAPPGPAMPLPGHPLQFRIAPSRIPRGRTLVLRTIVAAPAPPNRTVHRLRPGQLGIAAPVPPNRTIHLLSPGQQTAISRSLHGHAIPCVALPPPPCVWQAYAPKQLPLPMPPVPAHKLPHLYRSSLPCRAALVPAPGHSKVR